MKPHYKILKGYEADLMEEKGPHFYIDKNKSGVVYCSWSDGVIVRWWIYKKF